MSALSPFFEDFGTGQTGRRPASTQSDAESAADRNVDVFEQGYKAGWDDANKAQDEDKQRIAADLAQNLHEMQFTYAEAQSKIIAAMEPLLRELVETVLPQLAAENLGGFVVQELKKITAGQANVPVEIVLAPATRPKVEAILPEVSGMPLTITEQPTLGEGQVHLRMGTVEKQVDLMHVLDRINEAVAGFFHETEEEGKRHA